MGGDLQRKIVNDTKNDSPKIYIRDNFTDKSGFRLSATTVKKILAISSYPFKK